MGDRIDKSVRNASKNTSTQNLNKFVPYPQKLLNCLAVLSVQGVATVGAALVAVAPLLRFRYACLFRRIPSRNG
jgi:hypothetical protein